jgi:hypothetical protein
MLLLASSRTDASLGPELIVLSDECAEARNQLRL